MMKFRPVLALIAFSPLALATAPAFACDPAIRAPTETRIENYNALNGGFYTDPLKLDVVNNGGSACVGEVRFSAIGANIKLNGPRGEQLSYLIVDADSVSTVLFNPANPVQPARQIAIPPGQTRTIKARLYVVGGQAAASGNYTNNITAQFIRTSGAPPGTPLQSPPSPVALATTVLASLQANFVGTDSISANGRQGGIALGELIPGMRRDLGMQLRSNAPVDVTVSSANNGRLKRVASDSGIAYFVLLGGNTLDLASANVLELPTALTPGGRTNALSIQLSNFVNAPAGDYSDIITFRITAR